MRTEQEVRERLDQVQQWRMDGNYLDDSLKGREEALKWVLEEE